MRGARLAAAGWIAVAALAGCGGGGKSASHAQGSLHLALANYILQIEPLRLSVNRLLDRADPILHAYHDHRITPAQAASRMDALERQFAAYAVDIAAIQPANGPLRPLHDQYAGTYVFEDSYLSALVSGLRQRDLSHLPDTQNEQRAAIIRWRIGLSVLARKTGVTLPADLQQAGRGEIAPSPVGS